MIVVKAALSNLPRSVFLLAMALFILCVVGTLIALGVFFWYDMDFWEYFNMRPVLRVAAALLGGFAVSSGLLFWHYQRQESYMTFESIFFLSCSFLSLLNLLTLDRSGAVLPLKTSLRNRLVARFLLTRRSRNGRRNAWKKVIL